MVRGTGLVGRAVARFEQQREIGQRDAACGDNLNYRSHHNDAPSGGNTYQSFIPQPLRTHDTKLQSHRDVMTSPDLMTSQQHRELVELREAEAALRAELRELREHNELLEFRLLEKSACGDESDDVSDSGVSEELRELDPQNRMEMMESQHRDRIEMDPQHRDRIERLLSLSEPVLVSQKLSEEGLLSPLSMHESGIFDTLIIETESRSTQTELEEENTPDLRCEIQKLLRFREQVCGGNEKNIELNVLLQKLNDTSHGECERLNVALRCHEGRIKELSAKCERLGRENRRLVEASSDDGECERLGAKLRQQEYRLKELSERCERLQSENRRLDEERCEYEEAENDARLISQRLQTQVTWLSEQNSAVRAELRHNAGERGALRREARHWEGKAQQLEERNFELEELNVDTRHRLSCLEDAVPAILAFGVVLSARSRRRRGNNVAALPAPEIVEPVVKKTASCAVQTDEDAEVAELRAKVQAYGETLRLADQLWSQAEREYQQRLLGAEATLTRLRDRVSQLEEHVGRVRAVCSDDKIGALEARLAALQKSERRLQQHVHELEASEMSLKEELARSGTTAAARERRLQQDVARLREEAAEARAATCDLQRQEQTWQAQAVAARREGEALRVELKERQDALVEAQQALAQEEARGRTHRTRSALQLAEAECTSSELREEVETLEASLARVRGQLEAQKQAGERAILRLNLQLSDRERELAETRRELEFAGHHEAGVAALAQRAALAAHAVQECSRCRDVVRTEMCEISSQLRALGAIISGDVTSPKFHPQGSPGSTDDDDEELHPPVSPQHTVTSTGVKVIAGSRVRAVQRALLQASKPALSAALSARTVSELVAR